MRSTAGLLKLVTSCQIDYEHSVGHYIGDWTTYSREPDEISAIRNPITPGGEEYGLLEVYPSFDSVVDVVTKVSMGVGILVFVNAVYTKLLFLLRCCVRLVNWNIAILS